MQSVLKMMPTSMDKVGLMIFPGHGHAIQSDVASLSDAAELDAVSSTPTSSIRSARPWTATYNNGAGALVNTSPLIQAIGDYGTPL